MTKIFEKNGGTYRNENGILIPNLKAPESDKAIRKYGSLHKKFIKQNYRAFYSTLLIKGTLFDYLEKVDSMAKNEINRLIKDMAERQGITEELKAEGVKRELISKIQSMRKDAGYEVTDRITVNFVCDSVAIKNAILSDSLKTVVLANSVEEGEVVEGFAKDLDVNGETCKVIINKASK